MGFRDITLGAAILITILHLTKSCEIVLKSGREGLPKTTLLKTSPVREQEPGRFVMTLQPGTSKIYQTV